MYDSSMALSGLMQMLAMLKNAFYGGCGVGILNYFIYNIIAVFISGLMVGRTLEFFGHKVEGREFKIAAVITLLSAFLVKEIAYKSIGASGLLRRKLLIYRLGGLISPFISIKLIDLLLAFFM